MQSRGSASSSPRTLTDLENEIASLVSEFGEEYFFRALGAVFQSLGKQSLTSTEIVWDPEFGWMNVTERVLADWSGRFPKVDVKGELAKAHNWLIANPKNRKRRYRRFIEAWLSRSQKQSMAYHGGFKASDPSDRGFG